MAITVHWIWIRDRVATSIICVADEVVACRELLSRAKTTAKSGMVVVYASVDYANKDPTSGISFGLKSINSTHYMRSVSIVVWCGSSRSKGWGIGAQGTAVPHRGWGMSQPYRPESLHTFHRPDDLVRCSIIMNSLEMEGRPTKTMKCSESAIAYPRTTIIERYDFRGFQIPKTPME